MGVPNDIFSHLIAEYGSVMIADSAIRLQESLNFIPAGQTGRTSGFQCTHIIGEAFCRDNLSF